MIYGYRCDWGHETDVVAKMGEAPAETPCEKCDFIAQRDYGSVQVAKGDQFRSFWTSEKSQHLERPLDPLAPKDKFDVKHIEAATGRRYIGDDTSSLRIQNQQAISGQPVTWPSAIRKQKYLDRLKKAKCKLLV